MTQRGAAAAIAPEPDHGSGPVATADDVITFADLKDRERQLASTGACAHPVKLHGRVTAIDLATGEAAPVYDTASEPGGVLHVACGNRRETRCPACSAVYKRDARQLVRAGLTGGKGVPETVAAHPCVFATLTAPSFGPVHARRMRGKTVLPCRPRRDADKRVCPHGRDISCPVRHGEHDPRLGRPMCPDCYDYEAAVLFNLHAAALWRRFTTYLPRHLARLAGVTGKRLRKELRIRYVKVAEYQARGVIHFHAVIRLDANTKEGFVSAPGPLHGRAAVRRHRPGRQGRPHHRARLRPRHPARLRPRTRQTAHLAAAVRRHRPGAGSRCGSELHRQVRHQGRRRPRPARYPHPPRLRDRRAALPGPPQAHGRDGVGPRRADLDR